MSRPQVDRQTVPAVAAGTDVRSSADLDDLARQIVAALQADGRRPWRDIARRVGVSESTVARRARALISAGVIQPTIAIDTQRCGLGGTAVVSVVCDQDRAGEVAEALAERPDIRFVATTIGEQDVLAEVVVPPGTDLVQLVNGDLLRTKGIQRISCARVLRTHKAGHDWTFPVLGEAAEWEDIDAPSGAQQGAPISLDALDRQLMAILQLDCRVSFPRLAEETGSSESVVRRRVEVLFESGAVRALGLVDPRFLGYQCEFFLRLRTELAHLERAVSTLVGAGPVRYLSATSNVGELMAEVVLPTETDMLGFYASALGPLPGLLEASVSIEGRTLKRGFARTHRTDPIRAVW